jgi:glutaminyl-peptide cyclotransferase
MNTPSAAPRSASSGKSAPTNPKRSSLGFYGGIALAFALGLAGLAMMNRSTSSEASAQVTRTFKASDTKFDGERAYGVLKEICAIGPRVSASEGMLKQQAMLKEHFEKLGGKVTMQEFPARRPIDGARVQLANMIVEWHPERKERILLCAHYDTRPFPDEEPDPRKRRDPFIGANDGASGAAFLAEMAHHMPQLKSKYGVDFVLFDGEELVYDGARDPYFLGSEYFARQYASNPPEHRYRAGVLVDMIADKELQIYREVNSMSWPETRPIVLDLWETARQLGIREFIHRNGHEVRDDHLPLRNIGRIPTCDIIDFDYPRPHGPNYWHTTKDIPENCSADSLTKVGAVVLAWLERVK